MTTSDGHHGERGSLRRVARWLRWRWHLLRWRDRDATWHAIHSYGCPSCEAHDG